MEMVLRDPYYIKNIDNPSEEIQLVAVNKNGILLKFIKSPSVKVQWEALKNNVWAIEYIENPLEEMCILAVESAWNTLKFIKNPSENVLIKAVGSKGWSLQFVKNPSLELQRIATIKDWDSIKYISSPLEEIQLLAVDSYYGALSFIKEPTLRVKRKAITINAEAINFLKEINEEEMRLFLGDNIEIIKYKGSRVDIEIVKAVLKEKLASEEIDKDYIVKFADCEALILDKANFIYQFGSAKSKRIYVDYKLSY